MNREKEISAMLTRVLGGSQLRVNSLLELCRVIAGQLHVFATQWRRDDDDSPSWSLMATDSGT